MVGIFGNVYCVSRVDRTTILSIEIIEVLEKCQQLAARGPKEANLVFLILLLAAFQLFGPNVFALVLQHEVPLLKITPSF